MSKRLLSFLILVISVLMLGACTQINTLPNTTNLTDFTNAAFYQALQATVARVQIPVIIVGAITLIVGWKLGRFGFAINAATIGGLIFYTLMATNGWIPVETLRLGLSVMGGVIAGLLAYFLYNFMALIIGGAIGMMLMNGAWWQVAANVPPTILVFITTFISALVMFVVFRLFIVAFSAVIGAVVLMLSVPLNVLWVIPVAIAGAVIQTVIALWMKDDIFQNLRGDFGAALSEAFGEVLGPFGVLRERQQSEKGSKEKPARQQSPKPAPEPRPAARQQQPSPQPEYKPVQPQRPAPQPEVKPVQPQRPTPQQDYRPTQQPYQPAQQGYRPAQSQPSQQPQSSPTVSPQNKPITQPASQPPVPFRPEDFQLSLPNGQGVPLNMGSQITVGRNAENSIVINDPQISGVHMICSIQGDGVLVWDNNSTNGTYLNGILLTGVHRLTPTDVLQVGSVVLRLTRRNTQ